jgi:hypothetical protein
MGNTLYFLNGDKAEAMGEQAYDKEKELQDLIAKNPNILLPDEAGTRLFLIAQEFSIAEGGNSTNSYAIDHLMVDQSGVPVLVEVKRSSDTRARREVAAQMLDYASRASTWDAGKLRVLFRQSNEKDQVEDYDTNDFWLQVDTCLKAERLRLVFAADEIPDTLKVLIEFLSRSLTSIEVYGVEIRKYRTQGATLLSSAVVAGRPSEKQRPSLRGIEWDTSLFSSYLIEHGRQDSVDVSQQIQDFAASAGLSCQPGHGAKYPSFVVCLGRTRIFAVTSWEKGTRHVCVLEFCVRDLLDILPSGWTAHSLIELLGQMPIMPDPPQDDRIWETAHYFYIETQVLSIPENMEHLKVSISRLCAAIQERQGAALTSPDTQ